MTITPRWAPVPALLAALVGMLLLAGPAHAVCPPNAPDCGTGGATPVTWTNTLTVTRPARGNVTSTTTSTDGINCGTGTDCAGTSKQTTLCSADDCAEPNPDGWDSFTLTAAGPAGFTPQWTGCDSVSSNQCHLYLDADRTVSVNVVDTTDPVINMLNVNNAVNGRVGRIATVSATASDNDAVAKVEWFLNNGTTPVLTKTPGQGLSGTIDLSAPGFADGSMVTIRSRATDASNRISAEKSVTETIDKSVSETVGSVPAFTKAGTVPVTVATDPDASLRCSTSGAQTIASAPCSGTYSPLTASAPDGSYTYSVTATDAVGNVAVQSRTFTLDRTLPVIADVDGPPEGSQVTTTSVIMTFDVTDANLATVTCKLDTAAVAPCTGSATLSGLAAGTHRFTVTGTDKAGNTTSKTRTFSVTTTTTAPPPVITPTAGPSTTPTSTTTTKLEPNPARLVYGYALLGKQTRLPRLALAHVVKGSKITVRCKGPGCPKRKLVMEAKRSTVKLTSLQKRRFRAGAVLTIQVAKKGLKTKIVRITIRKRARPKVR